MMEWIDCNKEMPKRCVYGGKDIVILVNGVAQICRVAPIGVMYFDMGKFVFGEEGWGGDPRFAKPTHWTPLPSLPKELE